MGKSPSYRPPLNACRSDGAPCHPPQSQPGPRLRPSHPLPAGLPKYRPGGKVAHAAAVIRPIVAVSPVRVCDGTGAKIGVEANRRRRSAKGGKGGIPKNGMKRPGTASSPATTKGATKAGARTVMPSPRQSPRPHDSFDETAIIDGDGEGDMEASLQGGADVNSFLDGFELNLDPLDSVHDKGGSGTSTGARNSDAHKKSDGGDGDEGDGDERRALHFNEELMERAAAIMAPDLDSSAAIDRDGSVWAMCAAYASPPAFPVGSNGEDEVITEGSHSEKESSTGSIFAAREGEGDGQDVPETVMAISPVRLSPSKEMKGPNDTGASGVGVSLEPSEMISFLGESFLESSTPEKSRRNNNGDEENEEAVNASALTGAMNLLLSPLPEQPLGGRGGSLVDSEDSKLFFRDVEHAEQNGEDADDVSRERAVRWADNDVLGMSLGDTVPLDTSLAISVISDNEEGDDNVRIEGNKSLDVKNRLSPARGGMQTPDPTFTNRESGNRQRKYRDTPLVRFRVADNLEEEEDIGRECGEGSGSSDPLFAFLRGVPSEEEEEEVEGGHTSGNENKRISNSMELDSKEKSLQKAREEAETERRMRASAEKKIAELEARVAELEGSNQCENYNYGGEEVKRLAFGFPRTPRTTKGGIDALNESVVVSPPPSAPAELAKFCNAEVQTEGNRPATVGTIPAAAPTAADDVSSSAPAVLAAPVDSGYQRTLDLIERNRTLAKEVRFADQTCVELAEQKSHLEAQVRCLTERNKVFEGEIATLREDLLDSERRRVKAEGGLERAERLAAEEREGRARELLDLRGRLEEGATLRGELKERVARLESEREALEERIREAKEVAREAEGRADDAQAQVQNLREDLRAATEEAELVMSKMRESEVQDVVPAPSTPLHAIIEMPREESSTDKTTDEGFRTPTSGVLARTLRSELRRGEKARDQAAKLESRAVDAEARLRFNEENLRDARGRAEEAEQRLVEAEHRLGEIRKERDELLLLSGGAGGDQAAEIREGVMRTLLEEKEALLAEVTSLRNTMAELEAAVEERWREGESFVSDGASSLAEELRRAREELSRRAKRSEDAISSAEARRIKDLVLVAMSQLVYGCNTVQETAERRMADQCERMDRLADSVRYLQSRLDFEGSAAGTNDLHSAHSFVDGSSSDSVSEMDNGNRDAVAEGANDDGLDGSVINATFTSSHATRDSHSHASDENTLEMMEEARWDKVRLEEQLQSANQKLRCLNDEHEVLAQSLVAANAELEEQRDKVVCLRADYACEKSQLTGRVTKLEEMAENLQQKLTNATQEHKNTSNFLEKEVKHLQAKLSEAESELKICQARLEETEEDLEGLQWEKEELLDQITALEEASLLKAELSGVESDLEACQVKLEKAEGDMEGLMQEKKELLDEMRVLQDKLVVCKQEHLREKDALNAELIKLRTDLEEAQKGLQSFQLEAVSMLNNLESREEELEKENARMRTELEERTSEAEERCKIAEEAREDADIANRSARAAENALRMSQDAVEQLQSERDGLLQSTEEAKEKAEQANQSALSAEKAFRMCQDALEQLRSEKEGLINSAKETASNLSLSQSNLQLAEGEVTRLQQERCELEQELDAARRELTEANNLITARSDEIQKMKENLKQKEKEYNANFDHCLVLEDEVKRSKAAIDKDKTVIHELRAALHQCTEEMEQLKQSYVTCNDKLAGAMEQNSSHEVRIEELESNLVKSKQEMNDAAQKLHNEIEEVRVDAERTVAEKDETIKNLEEAKLEVKADLERKLALVQKERDHISKTMQDATGRLQSELAHIVSAANETANQCGVNEEVIKTAVRSPAQDRRPGLSVALDEVKYCHAVLNTVVTKVADQSEMLHEADLENQRLKSEASARFRAEEELRVKLTEEQVMKKKLEERLNRAMEEIEASADKLFSTEAALLQSRQSMSGVERELESTLCDFDRLKRINKEQKEVELTLERTREELSTALERLKEKDLSLESLVRQREEVSNALWASRENASKAEEELRIKAEKLADLNMKHDSLERKCVRLREYIKKLTKKCEEWAESYRAQSLELSEARRAHHLVPNPSAKMGHDVASRSNCIECNTLEEAVATAHGQNSELREELARSMKKSSASPKEMGVNWKELMLEETSRGRRSISYPKSPLQPHDVNVQNDCV